MDLMLIKIGWRETSLGVMDGGVRNTMVSHRGRRGSIREGIMLVINPDLWGVE